MMMVMKMGWGMSFLLLSVSKLQLSVDEDGKQTKIAHSMVAKDGEVITHIIQFDHLLSTHLI